MTTGKVTLDGRVPEFSNGLGGLPSDQWTGFYFDRDWTGGNSSPRAWTYKYLTQPDELRPNRRRIRVKVYTKSKRDPNNFTLYQNWKRTRTGVSEWWAQDMVKKYSTKPTSPFQFLTFDDVYTPNMMNSLVAKLGDRVNGETSFNPGIFLGEGKMSLKLIGESAVELAKRMSHFRLDAAKAALKALGGDQSGRNRGRRPGRRLPSDNTMGDAVLGTPGRFLEFQYGWRPLINDMHDGAEWLAAKFLAPKTQRYVVRGQKYVELETDMATGIAWKEGTGLARAQIIAYLTEDPKGKIDLNLVTPAQIAWELMPWSFVIDWALPIGTWLRSRGAAMALTGKFITTKTWFRRVEGFKLSSVGSEVTKARGGTLTGGYDFYTQQWRTISTSLAGLTKFPRSKGFSSVFTWEHSANGVALLATSLMRHPLDVLKDAGRWLAMRR